MFKVTRIDIDTPYDLIAVLKSTDAKKLGLSPKERIQVQCVISKKAIICELEIQECIESCSVLIEHGEVGLLGQAYDKLVCSHKTRVEISPMEKPISVEYVRKKFEGHRLRESEFNQIVQDIISNRFSEIETTYFVLACSAHKLDDNETIGLTKAMVNAGRRLDFSKISEIVVDKHCIGGVPNNRTTMIAVPIIAAAGLTIPKTSSRSITSPAGTADAMEVLTKVDIKLQRLFHVVKEFGGCIAWGGSLDLSPADDVIIRVEHPLGIDSEGQMIASILSKKKSAGSTHVLIDIPIGKDAKIKSREDGKRLKRRFEKVGSAIGLKVQVIITDGSQPIGNGIGPALEATDVMLVLENNPAAPQDLREKSLMMAGLILEMANTAKKGRGYEMAKLLLDSGRAYEKMKEIIRAQGEQKQIPKAKYIREVIAEKSGVLTSFNIRRISKTAFILGAPQTKEAGLYLKKKVGDLVKKGECIMQLHSNSELKIKYAQEYMQKHPEVFRLK